MRIIATVIWDVEREAMQVVFAGIEETPIGLKVMSDMLADASKHTLELSVAKEAQAMQKKSEMEQNNPRPLQPKPPTAQELYTKGVTAA